MRYTVTVSIREQETNKLVMHRADHNVNAQKVLKALEETIDIVKNPTEYFHPKPSNSEIRKDLL